MSFPVPEEWEMEHECLSSAILAGGLLLVEIAEGVTVEEVKAKTGAPLEVSKTLKRFD